MVTFKEIEKINRRKQESDSNFFTYVAAQKANKKKSLFISGLHSYFYDVNELKNFKSVINLKLLNDIKFLDDTIKDFSQTLSPKTLFCGKFIAAKIDSTFRTRYIKFKETLELLVDKTPRTLTVNGVTALLESYHFSIINFTEINGITYFTAKKL